MKCLNVVVLYENDREVEQYIEQVASISDGTIDVLVVVNSDRGGKTESMRKCLEGKKISCFRITDYGGNVGYLNALLKTVNRNDADEYDYVILSNTDIHYPTNTFFTELSQREYPADVGCIAPSVYSTATCSYQNPHYMDRIPKSKFEWLIRIFRYPAAAKLYLQLAGMKAKKAKQGKKDSCYVYSPNGSYMIFTADFIRAIKGYEYGVPLYSEESCVGELLRRNDMKCYYDSTIEVNHAESTVTGKINYRKRFAAWRESMIYIINTFYQGEAS